MLNYKFNTAKQLIKFIINFFFIFQLVFVIHFSLGISTYVRGKGGGRDRRIMETRLIFREVVLNTDQLIHGFMTKYIYI